jgi:biotin transport system substrate-specific component
MTIATPRLNRLPAEERGLTIADFLIPSAVGERISSRLRDAALVTLGALLIYLCSRVYIVLPYTPVPITGQTFGVLLVGGALGSRRGVASVGLYVLIGLVGVPFFAEHKSGIATILGPTGGYIVGFILAGWIVGRLAELGWDRRLVGALGAMAIGNLAIYLVGVPWLMAVTNLSFAQAIQEGVVPFLVGDVIKLLLAGAAFPAAWWLVGRRPGDDED